MERSLIDQFDAFWTMLQGLMILGIIIGIVFAIVFGSIKLGWKFAPWIVGASMLVWFLSFF